jgi:hypothetical protein
VDVFVQEYVVLVHLFQDKRDCGDDGVGGSMEEVFDSVGGGEVRYVEPAPKAKLGEVGFDTKFPLIVICVEQSSKVSSLVDPRQMR